MYKIRMGVPEMENLWKHLTTKADNNTLKGAEKQLFKKLTKTLGLLRRHRPQVLVVVPVMLARMLAADSSPRLANPAVIAAGPDGELLAGGGDGRLLRLVPQR